MKRGLRRTRAIAVALGALLLSLAIGRSFAARMDGPWAMIPGGAFLTGVPERSCSELPASRFADLAEVEVEVRAPQPRSITTWNVVVGGSVYLPADFLTPIKRWPHQVLADPRVRVRVHGQIYRCHAVRVTDTERVETLRRAIATKYAIEPDGWASRAQVWWFELRPAPG